MSQTVTQSFIIAITVTPVVAGISLSNTSATTDPHNAGAVIGAVAVTTNPPGGTTSAPVIMGGVDAAKFALTNTGHLPCYLVFGSSDVPAGNYSITLSVTQ